MPKISHFIKKGGKKRKITAIFLSVKWLKSWNSLFILIYLDSEWLSSAIGNKDFNFFSCYTFFIRCPCPSTYEIIHVKLKVGPVLFYSESLYLAHMKKGLSVYLDLYVACSKIINHIIFHVINGLNMRT